MTCCTGQNFRQCCVRNSRQLWIRKNPVQCYLSTLRTTLHMEKTLCNIVWEAPDNNLLEKILGNFVSILLVQHCTGQNSMKHCLRGSRQLGIRKNSVQCYLNTLRTTFHRSKLYVMLSEKLQATLHKKKCCSKLS